DVAKQPLIRRSCTGSEIQPTSRELDTVQKGSAFVSAAAHETVQRRREIRDEWARDVPGKSSGPYSRHSCHAQLKLRQRTSIATREAFAWPGTAYKRGRSASAPADTGATCISSPAHRFICIRDGRTRGSRFESMARWRYVGHLPGNDKIDARNCGQNTFRYKCSV